LRIRQFTGRGTNIHRACYFCRVKTKTMGRLLAIDYGRKRTGIAVSDPLQIIATGLTCVATNELISFLKDYTAKEEVEQFVLGMPLNWDESPTDATPWVEKTAAELKKHFPEIPLAFEDERNTSKMAVESMLRSGMKKKKRRKKEEVDVVSATLILQQYMQK